ncbi:MAG: response regulator transcription factor [Bacteroidota bacterium]|nr:response regulator transcription factor [Bacteroidota bacterium]
MPDILLVDDHLVIIAGLKTVIDNFLAHCKTDVAHDGDSAYEKIKHKNYDLIIMDVSLPNTDSFQTVSNILAMKPKSRILMFSMNAEELFAKRYLKLGAMGYLNKDASLNEIKNAIESTLKSNRYMSPTLKKRLAMDVIDDKHSKSEFDKLSHREFEIVQHLVQGNSVSDISRTLNLHTSTIGTHKARIFEKLQCQNIIELVTMAKVHNIIL